MLPQQLGAVKLHVGALHQERHVRSSLNTHLHIPVTPNLASENSKGTWMETESGARDRWRDMGGHWKVRTKPLAVLFLLVLCHNTVSLRRTLGKAPH